MKKPHHYHLEQFEAIRNMKGASTIFGQYFPLNMSTVLNNNLGEIGAKRNDYEEAAPPNIFIILFCGRGRGCSADEEMRDRAVGKF